MSKKVLLLLAEGFEDVEAVTPSDYLRRVGADLVIAAVASNRTVRSSRGLSLVADATLAELAAAGRWTTQSWDAVLVPGGMPGSANIAASSACAALIKDMADAGKLLAAICAAPAVVLAPLGILDGKHFTCFPGMEKDVSGAFWSEARVVKDGNIITSRSAGTAGEWSYHIVESLYGTEVAQKLAKSVLLMENLSQGT
ncbi:DJ-1/PfpI family protein [Treponema sp.]